MTDVFRELAVVLAERKQASPESSYVASLYHKGLNKILEKVGEECTETLLAAKDAERSGELLYVATLPITPSGKWQLVVSDASKDWKLRATLELPASNEIKLGY